MGGIKKEMDKEDFCKVLKIDEGRIKMLPRKISKSLLRDWKHKHNNVLIIMKCSVSLYSLSDGTNTFWYNNQGDLIEETLMVSLDVFDLSL